VEADPAYLPALLNLAGLALKAERKDEALAWLRRASALAPGSAAVNAWIKASGFSGDAAFGTAVVDSSVSSGSAGRASTPGAPAWIDE